MKFVVRLRPAFNNGPERKRIIEAASLREAQDKAFRRYGAHLVFGVEEARQTADAS